jgi:hypothetical protein
MSNGLDAIKAALEAGAAAWPLAAGLSVVLWSKTRVRQAQPAPCRVPARPYLVR